MTATEAARAWVARGFSVIPVPFREKKPVLDEWPKLRIGPDAIEAFFNGEKQNIGVLLGLLGTADVDLDCPEALPAWQELGPATGLIFGRRSKPASHHLYRVDPPLRTRQYKDPLDHAALLELRCLTSDGTVGLQTVVVGSVHPSGEEIRFEPGKDGEPASLPGTVLESAVARAAAAVALARHWPKQGSRHDAFLALAGGLTRAGWPEVQIVALHLAIYRAIWSEEVDRVTCWSEVRTTVEKHAAGGEVTGFPTLSELVDPKAVSTALKWLHLEPRETSTQTESSEPPVWPEPLEPEAYYGLAGDLVDAISPHSEADPASLLAQFLCMFGSVLGRQAHFVAEADQHYPNLFVCLVGATSKARKGSSMGQLRAFFQQLDPEWDHNHVLSGLSSGEGLIWHVRDPIYKHDKKGGEPVIVDPGIEDKRLLVFEAEFALVLRVMARETNTLTAIIRQAWDTGKLRTMVSGRTHPAPVATGAHISIVGHITAEELRRYMTETELASGFANRYLWICARRSKCLPRDEDRCVEPDVITRLLERARQVLEFAKGVGRMRRDAQAQEDWEVIYKQLSDPKPGLLGAATSRGEPQVMRLAMIHALLDRSAFIRRPHLEAALALWRYAESSAKFVFGSALGDPTADAILELLRQSPLGVKRTEISYHLGRHKTKDEIERALRAILIIAAARFVNEDTAGRSSQRWFAL